MIEVQNKLVCPFLGQEKCGTTSPILDLTETEVKIQTSIEEDGEYCYFIVDNGENSDEHVDILIASGEVLILNSEFEEIETMQGLSKFYLYVDKSSTFKVKSGQYGPEEKVTITVNTGGDEEIDEFMDTIVFPEIDITGDQGK